MTLLVVHAGDYKTGTTSVQATLEACADPIVETPRGRLIYPRAGRRGGGPHHNLAWKLLGSAMAREDAGGWPELAEEAAAAEADIIVISTETFESVSPSILSDEIGRRLGGLYDDLKVISYIRPHGERLLSAYSQKVKTGQEGAGLGPFARAAIGRNAFFFSERLKAWRAAFGDAFIARPYVRSALRDQDVVADFLHETLGMTPADLGVDEPVSVNESPSLEVVLTLRDLVAALGCADNRLDALWHENNVLRPIRNRPPLQATSKTRLWDWLCMPRSRLPGCFPTACVSPWSAG